MPIHSYLCKSCSAEFDELYSSFSKVEIEEPNVKCPKCGSIEKNRLFSATMVQFKGDGWTNKSIVGTSNRIKDSTGSIKDNSELIKEDLKNIKSEEIYNVNKPIDKG